MTCRTTLSTFCHFCCFVAFLSSSVSIFSEHIHVHVSDICRSSTAAHRLDNSLSFYVVILVLYRACCHGEHYDKRLLLLCKWRRAFEWIHIRFLEIFYPAYGDTRFFLVFFSTLCHTKLDSTVYAKFPLTPCNVSIHCLLTTSRFLIKDVGLWRHYVVC